MAAESPFRGSEFRELCSRCRLPTPLRCRRCRVPTCVDHTHRHASLWRTHLCGDCGGAFHQLVDAETEALEGTFRAPNHVLVAIGLVAIALFALAMSASFTIGSAFLFAAIAAAYVIDRRTPRPELARIRVAQRLESFVTTTPQRRLN